MLMIVLALLASIGLVIVAFGFGAGLTLLMIPFLLGLTVPLVLLVSLYPAVSVAEEGLRLQPNGMPGTFVRWEELEAIAEHTLLKPAPPPKLRREAHQGDMIIVRKGAVPFYYRLIGMMAGYGTSPVFAISNRTHVEFSALRRTLKNRLPHRKTADD